MIMINCEGCGEDIGTKEEIMEDMVEAHRVERNNTVEILCEACYHGQPLGSLREDYEAEEGKTRTFKITDIWYDTYDEEAEEMQGIKPFYDKHGYKQSHDQPDPSEMTITLDEDEGWEDRDLDMELADAVSDESGFMVYHYNWDEISPESKSAESAKDSDMMGKRWAVYHTTIPQEWLEANRRPSGGYPHHEPTLDISHQFYGDDRIAFDPQWYEQVATATFNEGHDGELLWRLTNNVDESWSRDFVLPNTFEWGEMKREKPLSIDENGKEWGLRSSMIGDIFHDLDNNEMWIVADFGFEKVHNPENKTFNVEFNEWADQEMNSHGKNISFKDWADDEGLKHGNTEITDWAEHEDESHDARYSAEELKKDSCCCGATKTHPCACMIQGIETCSATCPCSLEKKGAETYEDSWEKGVIRLAISSGCFNDEYAEWVERQIDGPNATLNNPRYKEIIDKRWGLNAENLGRRPGRKTCPCLTKSKR